MQLCFFYSNLFPVVPLWHSDCLFLLHSIFSSVFLLSFPCHFPSFFPVWLCPLTNGKFGFCHIKQPQRRNLDIHSHFMAKKTDIHTEPAHINYIGFHFNERNWQGCFQPSSEVTVNKGPDSKLTRWWCYLFSPLPKSSPLWYTYTHRNILIHRSSATVAIKMSQTETCLLLKHVNLSSSKKHFQWPRTEQSFLPYHAGISQWIFEGYCIA